MKLYWHDSHYKRIHQAAAKKSHKRQIYRRQLQTAENRANQRVRKAILKLRGEFKHLPIPAAFPKAPAEMCFLRNPEGIGRFIEQLTECLRERRPVLVHMEDVEHLELNAVTVLLAVMVEFRSKGIKFSGTQPENEHARRTLKRSGFFEHLNGRIESNPPYTFEGKSIHTHGNLKVDGEFSQGLIDRASRAVWGTEKRCPRLQRVLIELMHNTVNHASGTNPDKKNYWISTQEVTNENKTVFCFVDFGVGIFESLSARTITQRLGDVFKSDVSVLNRIREAFRLTNNSEILEWILTGKAHRTETNNYFRGKGLPSVYDALQKNGISNLSIITNDAYYSSETNTYKTLNTQFAGTFFSWELSRNNHSLLK